MHDRDPTSDLAPDDRDDDACPACDALVRYETRMHALSLAIDAGSKGDAAMAQAERYLAWGFEQPAGVH